MSENRNLLAAHPFFEGMSEDCIDRFAPKVQIKKFNTGDYIIKEGQEATEFYLIQSGKVNVITDVLESQDFAEPAPTAIQTLCGGEVLGWSWFVAPHEWHFSAKAIENTEVIVLDGYFLRDECEKDPVLGYEFSKRLMTCVSKRLTATRMELAIRHSKPFSQAEGG